ncbi:PEP-CTERM/exosortase system-associated acyltransferase [Halomonas sp. 1390]|uniref:PEP-CTERM/exosortase system-associated acyltransferase n=1 Tax=Halomonas sp. B23F22_3 TaxID=3459516 RepID=UPI00373E978F
MENPRTETQNKNREKTSHPGIDPDYFFDRFRLIIAHTPEEKQRAFSLRHAVFHEELHYDIGDKTNKPLEKDSYDNDSILCLLQHKSTGIDAGCLRVVIIDDKNENSEKLLPFEEYCGNSLMGSGFHPDMFPKNTICEVSRLAVHPSFRKREKPPTGIKDEDISKIDSVNEKQQPALIGLCLFLAATAIVGASQRRHVFAMIEPKLNRLLKASGLHFHKAGETIDHCGLRAAHYIDQKKAEENLPEKTNPLYQRIKKDLQQQIKKKRINERLPHDLYHEA